MDRYPEPAGGDSLSGDRQCDGRCEGAKADTDCTCHLEIGGREEGERA